MKQISVSCLYPRTVLSGTKWCTGRSFSLSAYLAFCWRTSCGSSLRCPHAAAALIQKNVSGHEKILQRHKHFVPLVDSRNKRRSPSPADKLLIHCWSKAFLVPVSVYIKISLCRFAWEMLQLILFDAFKNVLDLSFPSK